MSERNYIPKYFQLYELMPPELYTYDMMVSKDARERAFAACFDEKLLITIDIIRGDIIKAPLICNTWHQDGNRKYSGLRPQSCKVGAWNSQHKLGKAVDLICRDYTAEQMRRMIKENERLLPYPVRIEEGPSITWLHIDCKDMDYKGKKIYWFQG